MKFMVCYDSKEASATALRLAQAQAALIGASLDIIKVVTRSTSLEVSKIQKMESLLEAEVKEILQADQPPFDVELIITDLEAGEQIVAIADEENVAQIYFGIERRSRVGKLIFGSTLQYAILHAHCPVVSVRKDCQIKVHTGSLRSKERS